MLARVEYACNCLMLLGGVKHASGMIHWIRHDHNTCPACGWLQISEQMWTLWPLLVQCFHEWAIDYFENLLTPLDNFISRGTETFLAGQNPNYLQQVHTATLAVKGSTTLILWRLIVHLPIAGICKECILPTSSVWICEGLRILRLSSGPVLQCLGANAVDMCVAPLHLCIIQFSVA